MKVWFSSATLSIIGAACTQIFFQNEVTFDEVVYLSVITAMVPPAILNYVDRKWRKDVDRRLPDLFQSIVQALKAGMTIAQALEEATKRRYGALTIELKKIVTQISWGVEVKKALQHFYRRVDTAHVQRTIPLIIQANTTGGRIEQVFESTGKFLKTTAILEKERRNQTRPYIAIIYIAFFIFLFTIIIIFKSFFGSLGNLPMIGTSGVLPEEMRRKFLHLTLIQSFFGGLTIGKIGEGALNAGLKHIISMLICGYVAFEFFV
jgi:flagellar protein FlaJ